MPPSRVIITALWILPVFAAPDGAALYKARCTACHDGSPQPRMPTREEIGKRAPEEILKAMFAGAMQPQSAGLTPEDGRAIARFLTGKEFGKSGASLKGVCPDPGEPVRLQDGGWNGWSTDTANTRYQAESGLAADQISRLKLKWAFGTRSPLSQAAGSSVGSGSGIRLTTGTYRRPSKRTGGRRGQLAK